MKNSRFKDVKMSCLMTEDRAELCTKFINMLIISCNISNVLAHTGSPLFHDGEGGTHAIAYMTYDDKVHEWLADIQMI